VQQPEHALLGRIPTLDLVVPPPVSLVGVVGLPVAELGEFARELLSTAIG
jgi:hypothetical protein